MAAPPHAAKPVLLRLLGGLPRFFMHDMTSTLLRRSPVLPPFEIDASSERENYFRNILDQIPAAIYATDSLGRIVYFNQAAVELWGRQPEIGNSEWCGSWKLYWPDGSPLPHSECPMAVALKEQRQVRGISAVAERPDGSRISFLPFPTPLFDSDGKLIGAVNMLVDLSDRLRLERHAQLLAAIVTSSEDAIVSKTLDGIIQSWNCGAERLFGYTAEEAIGCSITMLIPDDRLSEETEILSRIRAGERIEHYETIRKRKDSSLVNVSITISPLRDDRGRIVGASKIGRDITGRKHAEEQRELLLSEMNHRIKNTLATVQAIAAQTLKNLSESERRTFVARLQSLAKAHDLLTRENWNSAALKDVVETALSPFLETHGGRVRLSHGDNPQLNAGQSLALSMILHELATNAAKYGALSNGRGRVEIAWSVQSAIDGRRVRFDWSEIDGPPVVEPDHKGFGSRMIERALADQGDVEFRFGAEGVFCRLDFRL